MKFQKPTHDYIATAQCGCVVGLIADMPGEEKQTAAPVATRTAAVGNVRGNTKMSATKSDAKPAGLSLREKRAKQIVAAKKAGAK